VTEHRTLEVASDEAGQRLDVFLARRLASLTRSQLEKLIKAGQVLVNGRPAKPGHRAEPGERVEVEVPEAPPALPRPEAIPLDIVWEDDHLLVVNKPPGLVVHPGPGRTEGTLVNALLAHTRSLAAGRGPLRPGIVHRLDRDTSGLLLVAKTDAAFAELVRQLRAREIERRYLALVWGQVKGDRLLIDLPVGQLLHRRSRMAAAPAPSAARQVRSAMTEVTVLERYPLLGAQAPPSHASGITLVEVKLHTGRTHQIRVHLAHEGHPVAGDPAYGTRRARAEMISLDRKTLDLVKALPGQALHAHRLVFRHPITGRELAFSVPAPAQMGALLAHMRRVVV